MVVCAISHHPKLSCVGERTSFHGAGGQVDASVAQRKHITSRESEYFASSQALIADADMPDSEIAHTHQFLRTISRNPPHSGIVDYERYAFVIMVLDLAFSPRVVDFLRATEWDVHDPEEQRQATAGQQQEVTCDARPSAPATPSSTKSHGSKTKKTGGTRRKGKHAKMQPAAAPAASETADEFSRLLKFLQNARADLNGVKVVRAAVERGLTLNAATRKASPSAPCPVQTLTHASCYSPHLRVGILSILAATMQGKFVGRHFMSIEETAAVFGAQLKETMGAAMESIERGGSRVERVVARGLLEKNLTQEQVVRADVERDAAAAAVLRMLFEADEHFQALGWFFTSAWNGGIGPAILTVASLNRPQTWKVLMQAMLRTKQTVLDGSSSTSGDRSPPTLLRAYTWKVDRGRQKVVRVSLLTHALTMSVRPVYLRQIVYLLGERDADLRGSHLSSHVRWWTDPRGGHDQQVSNSSGHRPSGGLPASTSDEEMNEDEQDEHQLLAGATHNHLPRVLAERADDLSLTLRALRGGVVSRGHVQTLSSIRTEFMENPIFALFKSIDQHSQVGAFIAQRPGYATAEEGMAFVKIVEAALAETGFASLCIAFGSMVEHYFRKLTLALQPVGGTSGKMKQVEGRAAGLFSVGQRVRVFGLLARPDLNGMSGKILRYVAPESPEQNAVDRWAVETDGDGKILSLKAENIEKIEKPFFFPRGQFLRTKPEAEELLSKDPHRWPRPARSKNLVDGGFALFYVNPKNFPPGTVDTAIAADRAIALMTLVADRLEMLSSTFVSGGGVEDQHQWHALPDDYLTQAHSSLRDEDGCSFLSGGVRYSVFAVLLGAWRVGQILPPAVAIGGVLYLDTYLRRKFAEEASMINVLTAFQVRFKIRPSLRVGGGVEVVFWMGDV